LLQIKTATEFVGGEQQPLSEALKHLKVPLVKKVRKHELLDIPSQFT
jgi:hypothetical protein